MNDDRRPVLHVITSLGVGGAEMMLLKVLGSLYGEYDFLVLSLKSMDEIGLRIERLGINVVSLAPQGRGAVGHWWSVLESVRAFRPMLIQAWMYDANVFSHALRSWLPGKVPLIVGVRGGMHAPATEKSRLKLMRLVDARLSIRSSCVLYNSNAVARRHEQFGYDRSKTRIIPNGFDVTRFAPYAEAAQRFRSAHRIERDDLLVGMVARYHPVKGHNVFLRAAKIVRKARPQCRFVLAGMGCDLDNPSFARELHRHDLGSSVLALGEIEELTDLYSALDVYVSASLSESFPNVLGEAMACGLPCAVTDVGDCAALVNGSGLVVPPGDADALALAVLQLLDEPPAERRRLGKIARARIAEDFSLGHAVDSYRSLYAELLNGVDARQRSRA